MVRFFGNGEGTFERRRVRRRRRLGRRRRRRQAQRRDGFGGRRDADDAGGSLDDVAERGVERVLEALRRRLELEEDVDVVGGAARRRRGAVQRAHLRLDGAVQRQQTRRLHVRQHLHTSTAKQKHIVSLVPNSQQVRPRKSTMDSID